MCRMPPSGLEHVSDGGESSLCLSIAAASSTSLLSFPSSLRVPPMPELPEVETMRRGILAIVGSRVADLWSPPLSFAP